MYTEKKITSIKTQNKEIKKMIKVIKKKTVHTTVQFIHDLKEVMVFLHYKDKCLIISANRLLSVTNIL